MRQNAPHRVPVRLGQRLGRRGAPVTDQFGKPCCNFAQWQDEISEACRDSGARHRSEFRFFRILHQNDAGRFFDRLDAHGPVRARARKDDGKAAIPLGGERAEKNIDRRALPSRFVKLGNRQMVIGYQELTVRRNDVDMARFQAHPARNLSDGHTRAARENARQLALMLGVEMHHNDEGGIDVGKTLEKHLQRLDPSRGGPDANDGKILRGRLEAALSLALRRGRLMGVIVHGSPERIGAYGAAR
jgi:hypothetical protein